ncbi:Rha family transcriptional regulator [Paraclostridium sordellii]|uniref:Rha family transcriptional regulator n=1 Tax=Paraclostridium sordellii TaxID=1505 RepID=UPI0005E5A6A7|nr:Rha family transcriptional regulator [Paeniclostridium sordellii]CEQ14818.1 anti-repressor [[Clostridium] sordellii] [Paeniclostridium sordellii]
MNNIIKTNNEVLTLDSREVAEMVEMEHKNLLRKIDEVNKDFNERKIELVKYWEESTYKDAKGEERRCLKITKRGCGFIAHKTTGTKGNIFTHKYMERFEEMEKQLQGNNLVPIDEIKNVIVEQVKEQLEKVDIKYSDYVRPLSTEKRRISQYIKERLGIDKANDEYKQVKNRVLMLLGADKWEDVPVETLLNSMNLIDQSIKVIKSERPYKQMNWF